MGSQLPRLGAMGIAGIGQMAPAAQNIFSRARGAVSGGARRTKKKAVRRAKSGGGKRRKKARAGRRTPTSGGSRATKSRLTKGSAAAKAYMAKIRKMRK